MKKFISPELEVICFDTVDVITGSIDGGGSSGGGHIPSVSSVPGLSDNSKDNLVNANIWVETVSE